MELPFVIEFEPPTRADLARLLGRGTRRGRWLVVVLALGLAGLAGGWWTVRNVGAGARGPDSSHLLDLSVSSRPPGARITLDGREQGRTPASLLVAPGLHDLGLLAAQAPEPPEARYRLQVDEPLRFEAVLWRRDAVVSRLRPALPGATLSSIDLLDDGRLALGVAVPPEADLQVWLLEPVSGALERLALGGGRGRLAVSPDGARVATLAPSGPAQAPLPSSGPVDVPLAANGLTDSGLGVWLWPTQPSSAPGRLVWWPDAGTRARPVDLTWSPRAVAPRLLVLSAEDLLGGSVRSQVWQLDLRGTTRDAAPEPARSLVSLPSAVVPGSFNWSPDGQRVAFLARTGGQRALCVLDLADGAFRYLADLDTSDSPGARLPFPPVAWSATGHRLLFVARGQDPPSGVLGWFDRPRRLVYRVDDDLVARPLGPIDADLVAWREDATSLVVLGRAKDDGPLALRAAEAGLSQFSQLVELPLRPPVYAARWDLPHARLLLASPAAGFGDGLDYTLVRLGTEIC